MKPKQYLEFARVDHDRAWERPPAYRPGFWQGDLVLGNDRQGEGGEQCLAPTHACRPPGVHHKPFTSRGGYILPEIHYYDTSGDKRDAQKR